MRQSSMLGVAERPLPCADSMAFLEDCMHGLSQVQKCIPCKWLYDDAGSALFEEICRVKEYYPSRVEAALLAEAAPSLADAMPADTVLVEFGSGASRKTRLLLDAAPAVTAYMPIDISEAELNRASMAIRTAYPRLAVSPQLGDFTQPLALDRTLAARPCFGFFPGSTLGNFAPDAAVAFLSAAQRLLGPNSTLLLGVDLAKDIDTLLAAYDDAAGVTAAFNLNLLVRMNRELGCAIDLDAFEHRAMWNAGDSRIEMHLLCTRAQVIALGGDIFQVAAGETIHTENSHKFSLDALSAMLAAAGWTVAREWISDAPSYALILARC